MIRPHRFSPIVNAAEDNAFQRRDASHNAKAIAAAA